MSALSFNKGAQVLAIGPHADDIEFGCGGTIMRLIEEFQADVYYRLMCPHLMEQHSLRLQEARHAAERLGIAMDDDVHFNVCFQFVDSRFDQNRRELREEIERMRAQIRPDLVFAPTLRDSNRDHREVAEAVQEVFCGGEAILAYERIRYVPSLFEPNLFVDVSQYALKKTAILAECFVSQADSAFFDALPIAAPMATRANQCGLGVTHAEAFEARISLL